MSYVLVVDDAEDIRASLIQIAEMEGYDVRSVPDGERALEAIEAYGPPHLMILDLMMPKMTGTEFLQRLPQDVFTFPVLVVSAAAKFFSSPHPNVVGVLAKPFALDDLLAFLPPRGAKPKLRLIQG